MTRYMEILIVTTFQQDFHVGYTLKCFFKTFLSQLTVCGCLQLWKVHAHPAALRQQAPNSAGTEWLLFAPLSCPTPPADTQHESHLC